MRDRRFLILALLGTLSISAQTALTYTNPVHIEAPGAGLVESCPDPSIIHDQATGPVNWYVFCTGDPLNDNDRDSNGALRGRLMTIHRSSDLVNWTYLGEVFSTCSGLDRWKQRLMGACDQVFQGTLLPLLHGANDDEGRARNRGRDQRFTRGALDRQRRTGGGGASWVYSLPSLNRSTELSTGTESISTSEATRVVCSFGLSQDGRSVPRQ